jgi:putative hemolysin
MTYARHALAQDGRLGVIFPSGRLAQRRGMRLHERPWMTSAAALARKYDLPVIPVHLRARNSALYYLLDAIHPSLRDITLFHETLNKAAQPYTVTIGAPIPATDLPRDPSEATAHLRAATLALGETPKTPGHRYCHSPPAAQGHCFALCAKSENQHRTARAAPLPGQSLARIRGASGAHGT